MRRVTTVGFGLWAMAPLVLVAGAGCVNIPGSGGCVSTEVEAAAVATGDPTEPVVLTGRLTADGEPVEGSELEFFLFRTDENGELQNGTTLGEVETDSDGRAERVFEGGSRDLPAFSTETVASYRVEYSSDSNVDGVEYCASSSEQAALDVPCAGFGCEW
ncbi:hypothetical protein [Glycomyces buryatensis]|uniref:Carboxypeptidase regulatory-like domain-containing protein n=1 Tax=Glycomyces buryatensis TaxID=2570927 RepID=A0A4S8PTF4_9ACTN|nr:hypothetical protein [Glycomyces buryatensis]THV34700.1 hypothetical protein FAB82_23925 [Glycomyces buryatensis]